MSTFAHKSELRDNALRRLLLPILPKRCGPSCKGMRRENKAYSLSERQAFEAGGIGHDISTLALRSSTSISCTPCAIGVNLPDFLVQRDQQCTECVMNCAKLCKQLPITSWFCEGNKSIDAERTLEQKAAESSERRILLSIG